MSNPLIEAAKWMAEPDNRPQEPEGPLFQLVETRYKIVDGKQEYRWGIRHRSGAWYPYNYATTEAAEIVKKYLMDAWETEPCILIWEFRNTKEVS